MKRLLDLTSEEARTHFLKGSSYFKADLPPYINFEPLLTDVAAVLGGRGYASVKSRDPATLANVNYTLIANKGGRFAWRPLELIHPAIYISLVNAICEEKSWDLIRTRLAQFEGGIVECCSAPVMSVGQHTDTGAQVRSWWGRVEQRSLEYALEFSHLLRTDVTDCYGSLYTHSIAWALHGLEEAKSSRRRNSLLGNRIDAHIQAGRYGQTNGISQGSVLMDFVAEIVLGYVDEQVSHEIGDKDSIRILRYRDDYRIFANSDDRAEEALKVVSDRLRSVGMKLGVAKTLLSRNVVEGSVKPDKLAAIELADLGTANAQTIQKQLLRLHSFGQRYPDSGAVRRLLSDFHTSIFQQTEAPDDLDVQVAIATDIAFVSPSTFPAVAGILSHLISLVAASEKRRLWSRVRSRMARVPHNGYLEIWLQRVTQPTTVGMDFESDEPICKLVNGKSAQIWDCSWIAEDALQQALDVARIVVAPVSEAEEVVSPDEVKLFRENASAY